MKNGLKILSIICLSSILNITTGTAQSNMNKQPQFVGGFNALADYLNQNIKYPSSARIASIEGVIYVGFIVNIDGSLSSVEVKKAQYQKVDKITSKTVPLDNTTDRSLEAEAIRVVKAMPKWVAGETDGQKTSIAYMLPVNFSLN